MQCLLDTNLLLRLIEPGHAHHRASTEAVRLLRERGHELVIVPQVLIEFWSVATRPLEKNGLGMNPAEANRELEAFQHLFRLRRDERTVFSIWELLVLAYEVKGKQVHDARLAAAMQRHAISHLLTFNGSDFARYPAVTVVSPLGIAGGNDTI